MRAPWSTQGTKSEPIAHRKAPWGKQEALLEFCCCTYLCMHRRSKMDRYAWDELAAITRNTANAIHNIILFEVLYLFHGTVRLLQSRTGNPSPLHMFDLFLLFDDAP